MNARERKKLFIEILSEKAVDREALKLLKRVQVPPTEIIAKEMGINETIPESEIIKRYVDLLLENIDDLLKHHVELKEHVEKYIELGLKPIPLYPGTKMPIGKKWRERYANITKDEIPLIWVTINNIGLLCGPPSNLMVLDFESKEAFEKWNEVLLSHPEFAKFAERLIPTVVVETGRGVHVWYIVDDTPENLEKLRNINGMTHKFFKDFEIRWVEGQAVAPPSLHPTGKLYKFAEAEGVTFTPENIGIKKITIEDVARILDIYHKTGKLNLETFKLHDYMNYLAFLLGIEEKYKSNVQYALAKIDFNTVVDDEKEAKLLNALKKIWPEPGGGRWAASCAISALLGILGVPQDTTSRLIEKLVRTLQPDTPERWIRDLAYLYPKVTYGDLEDYKKKVEEAKKLGKPIPKLPVAYKSLLLMHTAFTEEQVDEVRREVEQILGVKVADRLGFRKPKEEKPKPEVGPEEELEHLIQKYLLADELQAGDVLVDIIEGDDVEIPMKVVEVPIVKYVANSIRYMKKTIKLPLTEEYEPTYSYSIGYSLTTKPIKIEKIAYIGDEVFVKLNVGGFPLEGPIDLVISELQRKKMIVPNKGSWVGNYLSFLAKREKGEFFTRLGVHKTEDGQFTWVGPEHEKYYPVSPMRVEFAKAMEKYIKNSDEDSYKQFLEAIIKYRKYVNEEAYWFAMSFLFVGPFVSAARTIFKLAPLLVFHNHLPGSGKTNLGKFIIQVGHGIKPFDKDLLDSSFRFFETFDSVQGVIMFDEIGDIRPEVLDALIAAVTGSGSSARGRGISTMRLYEPVASALFTSNKDAWEISQEARWLDRIVQVEVSPNQELASEYLLEIDNPFALSAINDSERVTVAHYFLPELVERVNKLGGEKWLKERFEKWFKFAIEKQLTKAGGGRVIHKFAFFMVGLELMGKFLRAKGYDIDLKEGARVIYQHFKREAIQISKPLENFIYLLSKVKHEDTSLMEYTYHQDKRAYIITTDVINIIEDEAKKVDREVPHSLAALAALIASLKKYGTKDELYPSSGVKFRGRTRKAVLLPEDLVDEVLGYFSIEAEGEEEEYNPNIEAEVVNILSMQPMSFDELMEATGIPEHKLRNAILRLENAGIVYATGGKYIINAKKAKEAGFDIVEVIQK